MDCFACGKKVTPKDVKQHILDCPELNNRTITTEEIIMKIFENETGDNVFGSIGKKLLALGKSKTVRLKARVMVTAKDVKDELSKEEIAILNDLKDLLVKADKKLNLLDRITIIEKKVDGVLTGIKELKESLKNPVTLPEEIGVQLAGIEHSMAHLTSVFTPETPAVVTNLVQESGKPTKIKAVPDRKKA
jgi:hypothetical protein